MTNTDELAARQALAAATTAREAAEKAIRAALVVEAEKHYPDGLAVEEVMRVIRHVTKEAP